MSYFTPVHIIVLIILFIIFVFLLFLSFKESNKKTLVAMIFANFLVISMLAIFSMFVLDKYTKKARIENLKHKRVLRNESIVFGGKIRNLGKFTIGQCELEIKLVSDPVRSKRLGGSDIFKPTTGLSMGKEYKSSTVINTFKIAQNLKPKELRTFSVAFRYPPHLKHPSVHHKLHCR